MLAISTWLTGVYFMVEMVVGMSTGSITAIFDALRTFSAVTWVLVAAVAARIARRPADECKSCGCPQPTADRSSLSR